MQTQQAAKLNPTVQAILQDESKLREVYRAFHGKQGEENKKKAIDNFKKIVAEKRQAKHPGLAGLSDDQLQAGLPLVQRIITSCSEQEWINYLTKGEMPPVKLSAKEMELMKGGEIMVVSGGVFVAVLMLEGVIFVAIAVNS